MCVMLRTTNKGLEVANKLTTELIYSPPLFFLLTKTRSLCFYIFAGIEAYG